MGNSFIFLFAGHETSANVLHYALLFLAMHPATQRHLQSDIDSIVGSRPTSSWKYATDMGKLWNSMVGAVVNETLRLTPPVVRSPKIVRGGHQPITIDGNMCFIPSKSYIHLDIVGSNYNKRYFPHGPSKITNKLDDMEDFVPERWLLDNSADSTNSADFTNNDNKDIKQETIQDSSASGAIDGLETTSFDTAAGASSLFHPVHGAFIPFADGARACPGRRFAQVEITAILATIFKSYSVELDVSKWASDEEVARMAEQERKGEVAREKEKVYAKAVERARRLIRGSIPTIALKMEGEQVPIRVVRRERERFKGVGDG
jgi:cytochrome P450